MAQPGASQHQRVTMPPDDRVLGETRWLAALIIPFLVVAVAVLYIWPNDTGDSFAWPIKPPMSAMLLATAYIGGIYYFMRVVLASRWHTIKVGILAVAAFASVMGLATIVHWDRFSHGHLAFFLWAGLYFTTPFLVFAVWLRNRNTDPRLPEAGDVILSRSVRLVIGVVGGLSCAVSLLLFLQPNVVIAIWPWTLTPLTARVISAMSALLGIAGLGIASDIRWSTARIILEAQALSILLILIAVLRARNDFDWASWASWLFVGWWGGLLLLIVGLYIGIEVERDRSERLGEAGEGSRNARI